MKIVAREKCTAGVIRDMNINSGIVAEMMSLEHVVSAVLKPTLVSKVGSVIILAACGKKMSLHAIRGICTEEETIALRNFKGLRGAI